MTDATTPYQTPSKHSLTTTILRVSQLHTRSIRTPTLFHVLGILQSVLTFVILYVSVAAPPKIGIQAGPRVVDRMES